VGSGAEGPVAPGEHAKVAAEVGPLGVALYQRRVRLRHLRRKWRRLLRNGATCGGPGEVRRPESTEFLEDSGARTYDPLDELGGRDLLLGLVPKALTLLDFLQTECAILSSADACLVQGGVAAVVDGEDSNDAKLSFPAGSTSPLSRSIIVNAGSPTVAAALHEVVRHLPGFAGVKSSVVIGDAHAAQSFDQSRVVSSQVSDGWQGAESDDDAINAFQIGEVNILFVASENAAKIARDRRPLPLAGLVIYYDGKTRNLLDDAATIARRRIVTFFSANEKRHFALPPVAGAKANGAAKDAGGVSATPRQGCLAIQSPHGPKSVATGTTAGAGSVDTPEIAGTREGPKYDDVLGEKNEFNFKIRPPAALRGPSDAGGDVCYLYSISPFVPSDGTDGTVTKDATDVSSFAIVLTAELAEDDLVMSPVNDGTAVVEHSNCASLVLTHLGNTILSAEEVEAGRKYTAFLLSAVSKRHDPRAFQWGKIARENGDQTRRYLVLPLQSQSAVRNAKQCSLVTYDEDLLYREDCVQKYFGLDFIESSGKDSANCSGHALVDNSAMPTVSDAVAAGRTTVDWAAVYGIVSSQEAAQAASRQDSVSVPESVPCPRRHSVDLYAHFEGSLVFAQYDAKMKPYVTAHLDWSTSPLMSFVRQKRFDLDANGNLVEWKRAQKELVAGYVDLASLVPRNIVATEDQRSSSDVAQAAKLEADEMQSSGKRSRESASSLPQKEPIQSKNDLNRPLKKQCTGLPADDVPSSGELLPSAATEKISLPVVANNGGFRMQVFDAERNTRKRRKAWYGPVISSFERHLLETRSLTCKRLHQPLLSAVTPDCLPLAAFWRVAKGTPMSTITEEYLKSEVEINCDAGQMLVPEFTAEYAIPAGSLFLPSVLLLMERHLTTCAFRTLFAESLDCVIDIPRLNCALTSSSVSSSENYERLELLGDSVLKLGSTIRLFVKHPHYAEGDLHPIRCSIVSNNALSKKALEAGIKHYLNFTSSLLSDWNPPGYDMDAQSLPLHDKALADVLEAVTGAYYLQGASEYTAAHGNGEQQAAPTDGGEAAMSPSSSSLSLANGIVRGYVYGTRFLEAIGVLDTKEPSQEELLRAAIHAMHKPSAPPPTDTKPSSFPADRRMTHPSKPWESHLGRVEVELGYKFKRRQLLFCALTHGSFADSMHAGKPLLSKYETFQRLEFLGDAALDFCVARYLFDRYPNQGPGDLTELKSAVVSNEAFARISVERKFYAYLYTNSKAMRNEVDKFVRVCEAENADKDAGDSNEWWSREREAPKVLGDIFEAIIGAILVDAGLATVWNVCMRLLGPTLRERADPATFATHPVKLFQDFVTKEQRLSTAPPLYYIPEKGVMGSRLIRATVSVHKKPIATGEGSTKKRAMCMAAQKALARLAAAQRPQSADAGLLQKLRFLGEKERAVQAQLKRRF
jgi:dsRNA-specific ribonuclease